MSVLEIFNVNLQMSIATFDGGLHCVFYIPIILLGLLQCWNKKVCSFGYACLTTHVVCRSTLVCLYVEQANPLWAYLCICTFLQTRTVLFVLLELEECETRPPQRPHSVIAAMFCFICAVCIEYILVFLSFVFAGTDL